MWPRGTVDVELAHTCYTDGSWSDSGAVPTAAGSARVPALEGRDPERRCEAVQGAWRVRRRPPSAAAAALGKGGQGKVVARDCQCVL